jgi:N-methylhydantoinase A
MDALGIDVGGTFTDFVATVAGQLQTWKVATAHPPLQSILLGLRRLPRGRLTRLVYGTTVATNALLEGKWARTALLTTQGFRDLLEIGRQNRPDLYDLFCERPEPLVSRRWRLEVPERVDAEGRVLIPLDEGAVRKVARKLKGAVEAVAVVFLFSFLNPAHEQRVREILWAEGLTVPITLSCEVLPEFREYERTSTTVLTAALRPVVENHLLELEKTWSEEKVVPRLWIMQSNGGVASPQEAGRKAATLLLSGPAGGVMGARFVAERAGLQNLITLDMGGTSTDVCLIRAGEIPYTSEKLVAGRPVRLPMVDVHTVGAGGGSIAWLDETGWLRVGPQSAGARPGPACYNRGGKDPTVTDAHLCLGRFHPERPIGGLPPLSLRKAQAAVQGLGQKLGLSLETMALGILEVAEAHMEGAIRVISVERGYDPREFVLVAFGGAGPLHAASLARKLEIPKVFVPAQAGVLSALGLVVTDIVHTYVRSVLAPLRDVSVTRINAVLHELKREAEATLREESLGGDRCEFLFSADLRYLGQGFELPVAIPAPPWEEGSIFEITRRFHELHRQRYGFAHLAAEVELVSLRLTAVGNTEKPELPKIPQGREFSKARREERRAFFEGEGWRRTPVYWWPALPAGAEIRGPASVEGPESTALIPPGARAHVDPFGHLFLEV